MIQRKSTVYEYFLSQYQCLTTSCFVYVIVCSDDLPHISSILVVLYYVYTCSLLIEPVLCSAYFCFIHIIIVNMCCTMDYHYSNKELTIKGEVIVKLLLTGYPEVEVRTTQ